MAAEKRGSIAFFATYRPPVALEIYSSTLQPTSNHDELLMTDGEFYNYDGQVIPAAGLKKILKHTKLGSEGREADVDSGRLSGMLFVSEREKGRNLETLHIALRFNGNPPKVKVFNVADVFGTFDGVRMEDSGCIAGDYLVYVTTKDRATDRRQPWTAVYRTNLKTGKTDRLTPRAQADLSPAVSPSGKKIAVASFEERGGWKGEIEDLQTTIYVMDVENPLDRTKVVTNGGWPTWGSDNVIFFHRKVGEFWGVFRADIRSGDVTRVTPDGVHAITPSAIDTTTAAVAIIRQKSGFGDVRVAAQYRHIEIFDSTGRQGPIQITREVRPKADHFNPFVIDGGKRIGYHRCKDIGHEYAVVEQQFHKLECPHPNVGLFRVSGVFPTFSKDGTKLAFIDNEFKAVWLADKQGLRVVYEMRGAGSLFAPVWNQNSEKDTLYICKGPAFSPEKPVEIFAIFNVSSAKQIRKQLTKGGFNNGFPSSNPAGTKFVFRSGNTRFGGNKDFKNLCLMTNAQEGEYGEGNQEDKVIRLTKGDWTDTHCQWSPTEDWSPNGDWIVFSSTRDKPKVGVPDLDFKLDPGFFAIFLLNANNPSVVVRVMGSGNDLGGHINHPFFSPDGKTIVVTADLAAVSVDPISMPLFVHSVRPYGDIFTFEIDPVNITKNKNVKNFERITHSRYENSTAVWTDFSTRNPNAQWNLLLNKAKSYTPSCPYVHPDGGESQHMTGHLCISKRCC